MAEFRMNTSAAAFDILSTKLYSKPAEAIVRELVCNGLDAMVESGSEDMLEVGFELIEGSDTKLQWFCRDYGNGLNPIEVQKIYTVFFASTKGYDNEQIGSFGLGSKSPFSLVNKYFVESTITEGDMNHKYLYKMEKVDGVPTCELLKEEETFERTGLKVFFEVNNSNYRQLFDAICSVRKRLSKEIAFIGDPSTYSDNGVEKYKSTYKEEFGLYDYSSIKNFGYQYGFSYKTIVVNLSGYSYDIERGDMINIQNSISPDMLDLMERINNSLSIIPELRFNKNEVSLTPSREGLHFDDKTIKNIVASLDSFIENVVSYVIHLDSPKKIMSLYNTIIRSKLSHFATRLVEKVQEINLISKGSIVFYRHEDSKKKIGMYPQGNPFMTTMEDYITGSEEDLDYKVIVAYPGKKKTINRHLLEILPSREPTRNYIGMCGGYLHSLGQRFIVFCFKDKDMIDIFKKYSPKEIDRIISYDEFVENKVELPRKKRVAESLEEIFFKEDCYTFEDLHHWWGIGLNKTLLADKASNSSSKKYVVMTTTLKGNGISGNGQYRDLANFYGRIKDLNKNTSGGKYLPLLLEGFNKEFGNSCVRIMKNAAQYERMLANGYLSFSEAVKEFYNNVEMKNIFGNLIKEYLSVIFKKLPNKVLFSEVNLDTEFLDRYEIEKDSLIYGLVSLGNLEHEDPTLELFCETGNFMNVCSRFVSELHSLRNELSDAVDAYGIEGIVDQYDRAFIKTLVCGMQSEGYTSIDTMTRTVLTIFKDAINNYKIGPRFVNALAKIDSICEC